MTTGKEEAERRASPYPGDNQVTNRSFAAPAIAPRLREAWPGTPGGWGLTLVSLAVAAPAGASGDLVIFPDPPVLVTLIVAFTLLVFPLNRLIFKPLFRVIDERESKIGGATQEAQQLVSRVEALTGQYRSGVRAAREDAEAARKEQLEAARSEQNAITAAARAETEEEITRACSQIDASLEQARATLETASRDLARVAAERILGRSIS